MAEEDVIQIYDDENEIESDELQEVIEEESEVFLQEDSPNLVEELKRTEAGKIAMKKLAMQAVRDFDADWASAESFRKRMADDWRIFTGELPKKDYPWENAANPHVPIMIENVTRVMFRAKGELFGDWKNVFRVKKIGVEPAADTEAKILSRHGNWQIRQQIPDFKRQIGSRGLLSYFVVGDVTCHSYYDPVSKTNRHEVLTPDDFVIPFVHVTTSPDYSDVPHYTKVLRKYKHELQSKKGEWANVDRVLKREGGDDIEGEPEAEFRRAVADIQGEDVPEEMENRPFKLLQYEGWCDLPGQPRQRWTKMIVDYATHELLLLQIYEEEDWRDRVRYERQQEELDRYRMQLEEYSSMQEQMLQQQPMMSPEGMPIEGPQPPPQLPPPPEPPAWLEDGLDAPQEPRQVPIRDYTHAVCIEPMAGSLGISYGRIQADFNRAANTALSQFTDAAHLANNWSLITTNDLEFEEEFELSPGKINQARNVDPAALRQGIVELKPDHANSQLLDVVDRMFAYGQSSMQAHNVMSGAEGKSGETYRGLASRLEQATSQLSVIVGAYADFVGDVLKKNARLNYLHLPNEEIIWVTDDIQQMAQGPIRVSRDMYDRDYDVEIVSDLRFAPEGQRIQEADEALLMVQHVPPLQYNPAYLYHAVRKVLEAKGQQDMIPTLGPPPPNPQIPFSIPLPEQNGQQENNGESGAA